METFSIQNVINGQAIGISITGMAIVFVGLVLISGYIALLPVVLTLLSGKGSLVRTGAAKTRTEVPTEKQGMPISETKAVAEDFNDIASVIGLVLQLEHERFTKAENEQITILRKTNRPSLWGSAGKMRKMPQRRTHA
jgi:hypothetical protein